MSDELIRRYEEDKKLLGEMEEKLRKFEVAQEVAAEKSSSLRKELEDMGIDPDEVSTWLRNEEERLVKEMDEFDAQAEKVQAALDKIESAVRETASE